MFSRWQPLLAWAAASVMSCVPGRAGLESQPEVYMLSVVAVRRILNTNLFET